MSSYCCIEIRYIAITSAFYIGDRDIEVFLSKRKEVFVITIIVVVDSCGLRKFDWYVFDIRYLHTSIEHIIFGHALHNID